MRILNVLKDMGVVFSDSYYLDKSIEEMLVDIFFYSGFVQSRRMQAVIDRHYEIITREADIIGFSYEDSKRAVEFGAEMHRNQDRTVMN